MLFDLRSRGRRRTVQAVYLSLALILGLGLVLFGVGTGSGIGGLLNAFTGNGSGSNQNQVVNQGVQSALKVVKTQPTSSAAWSQLVQARWTAAGDNYNATTKQFTAEGKKQLQGAIQAWNSYLPLTKSPDPSVATIAARSYAILGQYGSASNTWAAVATNDPTDVGAFECMAVNAYAAGQTRKGDLATSKVLSLLPKASQAQIKPDLQAARSSSSDAQSLVSANCES